MQSKAIGKAFIGGSLRHFWQGLGQLLLRAVKVFQLVNVGIVGGKKNAKISSNAVSGSARNDQPVTICRSCSRKVRLAAAAGAQTGFTHRRRLRVADYRIMTTIPTAFRKVSSTRTSPGYFSSYVTISHTTT